MRVAGPLSKRPRISSIGGFLGLYNWLEPGNGLRGSGLLSFKFDFCSLDLELFHVYRSSKKIAGRPFPSLLRTPWPPNTRPGTVGLCVLAYCSELTAASTLRSFAVSTRVRSRAGITEFPIMGG